VSVMVCLVIMVGGEESAVPDVAVAGLPTA
jgi:hypothetical protein